MKRIRILWLALILTLAAFQPVAEAGTLKKGSTGKEVREMQERLNLLGYYDAELDENFGRRTEIALKAFQKDSMPEAEATGIQDDETRARMEEAINQVREAEGSHVYGYYRRDCGWEEANNIAAAMGGHLVRIDSMAEYRRIIREYPYEEKGPYWIGAYRSQSHTRDHSRFYWVGDDRNIDTEPIDTDALFNNEYNPWALDEPSYRGSDDAPERFVRLNYSEGEQRWVWEDVDGQSAQGFIVEFDNLESPPEEISDEDIQNAKAEGYDLEICALEGCDLRVKVTAEEACYIGLRFKGDQGFEDHCFDYIPGNSKNRVFWFELPDIQYNDTKDRVEGNLFRLNEAEALTPLLDDWKSCPSEGGAPPNASRLQSGIHFASNAPIVSSVKERCTVIVEVLDGETGDPMKDVSVCLSFQGMSINATTDGKGRCSFKDIACGVQGRLSIGDRGYVQSLKTDTESSVQVIITPKKNQTLIGSFRDESGAYSEAFNEFKKKAGRGDLGAPEACYWFIGNWLYFDADNGTTYIVNGDGSRDIQKSNPDYDEFLGEHKLPLDQEVTINGIIRQNDLKNNNRYYDGRYVDPDVPLMIDITGIQPQIQPEMGPSGETE